ncbi:peptidoglycan DD-metalloendopeptidase family protein [candidate division WOR-3 bacterium]|nr:peptidoglycan DD-metalloendopeptidase family protein [candidate division WOR-3 bacterium]
MKRWTLHIGRKQLTINTCWVISGIVVIIGLLLASGSVIFQIVNSNINNKRYVKEVQKSLKLNTSLLSLKYRLKTLNTKLETLVNLDKKERLKWDLTFIDEDIRKLGTGGRNISNPLTHQPIDKIKETLLELKNKIDFESESFKEIIGQIESKKELLLSTPSIFPTQGVITSHFGWRRRWRRSLEFHKGLDIANQIGTPVITPASGIISYVGRRKGFGLMLEVDHGFGYKTRYGHLLRVKVMPYKKVDRGEVIAYMGNSGKSTGPHLHYEVRVLGKAVNPLNYIIPDTVIY